MNYFFENRRNKIFLLHNTCLDFPAHLHTEAELGYCKEGNSILYLEDKKFEIKKGDFFIIFPNQVHRYELSKNILASIIFLPLETVPEFRNVLLKKSPISPIINKNTKNAIQLIKIIEDLFQNKSQHTEQAFRGLALALCANLFDNLNFENRSETNITTLKNILTYCNEHFQEPITIDDVSKNLFISRSHISSLFKNKLNSTFLEYIASKRIELACKMLDNSTDSITEIAFSTGFKSVRTFNRTFSKAIGYSPREYRQRFNNQ